MLPVEFLAKRVGPHSHNFSPLLAELLRSKDAPLFLGLLVQPFCNSRFRHHNITHTSTHATIIAAGNSTVVTLSVASASSDKPLRTANIA